MAGPAGAHGGGHPDHGEHGSATEGSAGTGAESAAGGAALGPDAPAFGGTDPGGGGSGGSSDTSIAAFREAIARAMGVTAVTEQEAVSQAQTEAELDAIANARARSAAVEARDKAQREAREQQEREAMMAEIEAMQNVSNFATPAPATTAVDLDAYDSRFASPHSMVDETEVDPSMFDDPLDNSPVTPSPLAHLSTYHGQNTRNFNTTGFDPSRSTGLHDPQGTEAGLAAAQAAMDGLSAGSRTIGAHPSKDPRIGLPLGTGRPSTDIENREPVDMYGRVAPIEDIEDPEERAAAYEMLGKLQKAAQEARTPWGRALNTIMGYGINAVPGMGQLNMIGKAVKAGLAKAGMNVDPNIIGQAIRAAHEITTQGPLGAGGISVGARNDAFIEEFLRNIPASSYDEPWMKGLNERQIKYYLDRPSELEWVRNLWNQMNPS